jgi:Fe-S-cluster containining protein
MDEARALPRKRMPSNDKKESLINIAEGICKLITSELVCSSGCSHCCYMAVAVSTYEAEMISRFTGRALATKGDTLNFIKGEDVAKYAGVPCTFLKDGKCEIYPVRTIACRLHHHLGPDNEPCKLKGVKELKPTSSLNLQEINEIYCDIAFHSGDDFSDIRDFFPPKE